MNQAALELITCPEVTTASHRTTAADATGFDIGWDHAHHGLVPPAELLLEGTPIGQGWRAGRAVFGRRTLTTGRATRQWLALRTRAWRQGIGFDDRRVTAHYLAQLHTERCPVLRRPLGGAAGHADAAVVERLNPQAGYAAGNLALMSHAAAQAGQGVDVLEALRCATLAAAGHDAVGGLDAAAWQRLSTLRAFATCLPFHEAARVPLAVLPPGHVRSVNAVQGLQVLITQQFMASGWSARTRALAQLLPAQSLRHDFNLFVGALAPRVLEAGTGAQMLRQALEDAWLHERVQRRWQNFVLSLGEAATHSLLAAAAAPIQANGRKLPASRAGAVKPWARLGSNGAALPWHPRSTGPARGPAVRAAADNPAR